MQTHHSIIALLCLFISTLSWAQQSHPKTGFNYEIHIQKATQSIKLDGILNEPDWQNAQIAKDFYQT